MNIGSLETSKFLRMKITNCVNDISTDLQCEEQDVVDEKLKDIIIMGNVVTEKIDHTKHNERPTKLVD